MFIKNKQYHTDHCYNFINRNPHDNTENGKQRTPSHQYTDQTINHFKYMYIHVQTFYTVTVHFTLKNFTTKKNIFFRLRRLAASATHM